MKCPFHPQRDEESKKSNSENSQSKQSAKAASSSFGDHFSPNLCGAYSAMLHVFRMLTPHERFTAARVCRMWRDLAYNRSLWSSISLKVGPVVHEIILGPRRGGNDAGYEWFTELDIHMLT